MKKWLPIIATTLIFAACAKNETGAPTTETTAAPATDSSAVRAAYTSAFGVEPKSAEELGSLSCRR